MSDQKPSTPPYQNLGYRLKRLREKMHESLVEVSGAVEIDPDNLAKIENGEHRPSEDVLLLLISHLDPQEEEAVQLWELAGYDKAHPSGHNDDAVNSKPIVMLLQPDSRIMYSDVVNIVPSQQGIVMNFLQAQAKDQAVAIARVGMSHQQALRVFEALGHSLKGTQRPQGLLPESSIEKNQD